MQLIMSNQVHKLKEFSQTEVIACICRSFFISGGPTVGILRAPGNEGGGIPT